MSSDGAGRYVMRTVKDFLAVPKERRAACLAEFADALAVMAAIEDNPSISVEWHGFDWVDDGKCEREVEIEPPRPRRPAPPISDDDILSLWRTARPSWAQNDAMTTGHGHADDAQPTPELRHLIELAMQEGMARGMGK